MYIYNQIMLHLKAWQKWLLSHLYVNMARCSVLLCDRGFQQSLTTRLSRFPLSFRGNIYRTKEHFKKLAGGGIWIWSGFYIPYCCEDFIYNRPGNRYIYIYTVEAWFYQMQLYPQQTANTTFKPLSYGNSKQNLFNRVVRWLKTSNVCFKPDTSISDTMYCIWLKASFSVFNLQCILNP